ncbi:hypothetical protein T06_13737 [Trichinella sp. T6]|nr:hypothetical protein T06_13737 [Trichinella sp. T6]
MPLSLADFGTSVSRFFMFRSGFRDAVKGNMANVKPQALPSGYAPGQIKICIFPQAMPQAIYSTIFDLRGPRLCPQATPQGK